jgi:hypothetical protein
VVVASAVAVAAAATGPYGDPGIPPGTTLANFRANNVNIPELAWRGEELRFTKCDPSIPSEGSVLPNQTYPGFFSGGRANLWVEDFSAPNQSDGTATPWPQPVSGTFAFYHSASLGMNCVTGDFASNKAGIAQIKLVVTYNGAKVLEHSFLAGWMAINTAAITNPGTYPAGSTATTGGEIPGCCPGNAANVLVTGSIPVNAEFQADWGLPATLVLPRDWAIWAHAMASESQEQQEAYPAIAPWQYWDIHDSSSPVSTDTPDTHVGVPTQCPLPSVASTTRTDQVDNCRGGANESQFGINFSRIFADYGGSGTGPFDANISSTLLSDGVLNAADAPMPPLRINFTSTGGMGYFTNVNQALNDKHVIYSRDGTGAATTAHNLYAPYYGEYIPATSNPNDAASGTDAPSDATASESGAGGNNFEGYLVNGLYHFWDQIRRVSDQGGPSPCLLRDVAGQPMYRPLNEGPTVSAVYTDEHGEARIGWVPGMGNNGFGTTVGYVDQNGGCDQEGVQLGPITITATAQYPNQNVALPTAVTGAITKNISNLFRKWVVCNRKNNASSAVAYICTAYAQDINGAGAVFNGERVCFSREPENPFFGPGVFRYNGFYCITLSGGGTAPNTPASGSIETNATLIGSAVDVTAWFVDEHLLRDTCIISGMTQSTQGPCGGGTGGTSSGGTTGGTTTGGVSGSTGGTTGGSSSVGSTQITSHGTVRPVVIPKAKATASVQVVRLVATAKGRVLMVRIFAPKAQKSAKIRIQLINSRGRVISTVVRSVKTNKLVKVSNVKISKSVKSVKVRIAS